MVHVLPDGTRIHIRPIRPGDKPRLAAAIARLSPESARRRFLAAKPGLTKGELRYLTEVDGEDHLALVALAGEEDDAPIAGVARCVREHPGSDAAEFAIVIGDPLQGMGLGGALAAALADAACRVGIRRFTASTLADNIAVTRLLDSVALRTHVRAQEGGVRELVAELPECPGARAFAA
jgi:RimJ/RimL family protein N-acetyltransferase